jgi:hypothetical protein
METEKKYLIYEMETGLCVNAVVWDGVSFYEPGDGLAVEIVPAGSQAWIGWTRTGVESWVSPEVVQIETEEIL